MPDIPENPAPADPTYRDSTAKKSTARLIPLPLTEKQPGSGPTSGDKGNPAPNGNTPAMRQSVPDSAPLPKEGIRPGPPPNLKMHTIRIELDDILAPPGQPLDRKQVTIPISKLMSTEKPVPRPVDRKQVTMPISELMSAEQPMPRPVDRKQVTMPHEDGNIPGREGAKKKTTHLTVEPMPDDIVSKETKHSTSPITVIPQTIRLKRTSGLNQAVPPAAKSRTDLISEAPTLGRMPDLSQAKMVTARILVEPTEQENIPPAEDKRRTSVISTTSGEPTPQTIHLKRPAVASLEETGEAGPASEAPTIMKAGIPGGNAPEEGGPTTITQRKTIKIKRTERNVSPRTVKLRQPDAIARAAPEAMGQTVAPIAAEEEASPLFFTIAAAAVILIAGLVYFMAAQAFGPELILPVPESLL